ncbi:hypothetical protein EDB85DRAFT_1983770 [Lactarius pseudohatsudake]|nr:hypothetical protein EDB85DRAFT_1983770 [Lactarius pseudohatsudake]
MHRGLYQTWLGLVSARVRYTPLPGLLFVYFPTIASSRLASSYYLFISRSGLAGHTVESEIIVNYPYFLPFCRMHLAVGIFSTKGCYLVSFMLPSPLRLATRSSYRTFTIFLNL